MAASVIHRCQHCGFETDLGASLDVFEQNPHCGRVCKPFHRHSIPSHVWQCGLSGSEGDLKMQEELATLMTQHLNLDNNIKYHNQLELPPTPPQPASQPQMTYITQHYHHSAHQAAPTPPAEQTLIQEELARHGIDASALFPTQLNLFKQAQPEQQSRLIQLWSISPPTHGNQVLAKEYNWPQTSMEQEEEAAQSRYMKMRAESNNSSPEQRHHAEPYIIRGYESSANISGVVAEPGFDVRTREYNRALDPAYQSREWWMHESQPIEHQYGMVQQMRQFADEDEDMS
jgi:hypothetical protein